MLISLLPEGSYEIDDINKAIEHQMQQKNHYNSLHNKAFITLSGNENTLRSVMEATGRNKVDFRPPRSILGFRKRVYHAGYNESENIVNIF
jgi:hypothetical protein